LGGQRGEDFGLSAKLDRFELFLAGSATRGALARRDSRSSYCTSLVRGLSNAACVSDEFVEAVHQRRLIGELCEIHQQSPDAT